MEGGEPQKVTWRLKMAARRVANSHHFDVEQDPDPHSIGESDPNPHRNEKMGSEVMRIRDPGLYSCAVSR
jgi:hypothetical protein